jgi:hypothetical protein
VLTRDPIFDWFAYGGSLAVETDTLRIIPRDGLRQRFYAIIAADPKNANSPVRRFKMELNRDGFAAEKEIATDKSLNKLAFSLENRTGDEHTTELLLSPPDGSSYSVLQNGKAIPLKQTEIWDYPLRAELKIGLQPCTIEIVSASR